MAAPLTITDAAWGQIRVALDQSTIATPVISLVQSSQSFAPSDALLGALRSDADEQTFRAIGMEHIASVSAKIRWHLEAGVYPREQIPPDCLVQIQGVWFEFPPLMLGSMDGWELDAKGDSLVLKDAVGSVILPHDLPVGEVDGA